MILFIAPPTQLRHDIKAATTTTTNNHDYKKIEMLITQNNTA